MQAIASRGGWDRDGRWTPLPFVDPAAAERLLWASSGWRATSSAHRSRRRVELNGETYTIVGVAPRGFAYPAADVDVWVGYSWPRGFLSQPWFRFAHFVRPFARLAPGVGPEEASRELAMIAAQLEREHPESNRGYSAGATPLHEWIVGDSRRPLLVLLAAVGLLLLVACANVAVPPVADPLPLL